METVRCAWCRVELVGVVGHLDEDGDPVCCVCICTHEQTCDHVIDAARGNAELIEMFSFKKPGVRVKRAA